MRRRWIRRGSAVDIRTVVRATVRVHRAGLRIPDDLRRAYLRQLAAIDERAAADESGAMSAALGICVDIERGAAATTIEKNAASRFAVDAAAATEIVTATRTSICRQ